MNGCSLQYPPHLLHLHINLRDGFFHFCLLLNESTRQLDIVIGNDGHGHVKHQMGDPGDQVRKYM